MAGEKKVLQKTTLPKTALHTKYCVHAIFLSLNVLKMEASCIKLLLYLLKVDDEPLTTKRE